MTPDEIDAKWGTTNPVARCAAAHGVSTADAMMIADMLIHGRIISNVMAVTYNGVPYRQFRIDLRELCNRWKPAFSA